MNDSHLHLSNAPIVEAVVDVRVKLSSNFKLEVFHPLCEELQTNYSQRLDQQVVEQTIKQQPGQPAEFSTRISGIHGYRLSSEDGKQIVQLRRDGFTFSRLQPYTTWEEIFAEAWRLWGMYVDTAKPTEVSRIAVRYINRLLLPLPCIDLSKYLNAPPVVAEGWPVSLSAFLTRVVINDPESEIAVNVIQALEPQAGREGTHLTALFDIDAYQILSLDPDDVTIEERFGRLREMKNRIFFGGLTTEAIELFK
jgi:uncharacterized protein (TIGR04255 family)